MRRYVFYLGIAAIVLLLLHAAPVWCDPVSQNGRLVPIKDIRLLNQHFNRPGTDTAPWRFVPEDNIKTISTTDHPGVATIWQAGKGKDIKGILTDPIKIDEYPTPWEYEMSLIPNYSATIMGTGDLQQNNYAVGLNLAVTFSDPATWPQDRTQLPPDTRTFQLFSVHLGSTSEFSPGLPQFSRYAWPETFLVWGRGDLDEKLVGDWKIDYVWPGTPNSGPASPQALFRVQLVDPTHIKVGIKFYAANDFEMQGWTRTIDCSGLGPITGIWEIGPIFSCDRWIPDALCPQLPVTKQVPDPPQPIAPNPVFSFIVDYCTFMYSYPTTPLEHNSDDFDIPGFLGLWRGFQAPYGVETYSNPGYLTFTLLGSSQGLWFGPRNICELDLKHYPPPWEMEVCFIAPDESIPWNFFFLQELVDQAGKSHGYWQPGVQNLPDQKRHEFFNDYRRRPMLSDNLTTLIRKRISMGPEENLRPVKLEFDSPIPEEILAHKPLYMLYQLIDRSHVRIGYKARPEDPWYFSKVFDFSTVLPGGLGKLGLTCLGSATGTDWGCPPGSPMYQKLLIDYVHYRYGLSTDPPGNIQEK